MSKLSICIHKSPSKAIDNNEIAEICGKFGTILSTHPTDLFYFVNFKEIGNIGGCIKKLKNASYSAEESRKNVRRRKKFGVTETDQSLPGSEDESDSGQGSNSDMNIEKSGPCKNLNCKKTTSMVCGRCSDFFCSNECLHEEWEAHRYICFPIPKVIPIKKYEAKSITSIPSTPTNIKSQSTKSLSGKSSPVPRNVQKSNHQKNKASVSSYKEVPLELFESEEITEEGIKELFNKYYGFGGGRSNITNITD
ncbi:hypothetical protein ACFFRR_002454 [Megaselia abdita]